LNERAETVISHPSNEHLCSWLDNQHLALDIGHVRSTTGDITTLATIGRTGDVYVAGSSISKIQCSFEINLETNVVMFYDRSHSQTCQFHGEDAMPFLYGLPRKVVVQNKINTILGMGGVKRNHVQFRLRWHSNLADTMEKIMQRGGVAIEENPRLARTIDETDTILPSQRETRLHTPGLQQPAIRYAEIGGLGAGQFGEVKKVVDIYSGRLMAVKILKEQTGDRMTLKREVEILSRLSHVSELLPLH
jgi:hypothetical protein